MAQALEEKKLAAERARIPPGMTLVSEAERLETLSELAQRREEVIREISSLPITHETLRIRKRRQELEQKVGEIDAAVAIFSRKDVFVLDE